MDLDCAVSVSEMWPHRLDSRSMREVMKDAI